MLEGDEGRGQGGGGGGGGGGVKLEKGFLPTWQIE